MPKMTDYVREGFNKKTRPWEKSELPEWWDLAMWVALGAIGLVIVYGVIFDSDQEGASAGGTPRRAAPAQTIASPVVTPTGPHDPAASRPAPTSSVSAPPASAPTADYAASDPVRVAVTAGTTTAIVPAGARNVAAAAARALATGDWSGIPLAAGTHAPAQARTPNGTVAGEVTVTDIANTGSNFYVFNATINRPGKQAYRADIKVEPSPSGFVIRPG